VLPCKNTIYQQFKSDMKTKVAIIGAGLSGLTCAWYLKESEQYDITIFESSGRAGGKLQTELLNGFQLDRGFQVLLPAYPETKRILDYDKLQLQRFHKGSLIFKNHKQIPFYDPENGLSALIKTVLYGPGSLIDKFILLKLKYTLSRLSVAHIFQSTTKMSSLEYLRSLGFSERIIADFWIPFYQGVFLENTLETDSKMLQFTFKMFAEAGAAVPKEGMEAIPKQLIAAIGSDRIRYHAKVLAYNATSVTTSEGKTEIFDKVVVAYNSSKELKYHAVTNKYFEADKIPIQTKHVILNANKNRVINNVVFISHVAPNYALNGKQLISVSANGIHPDSEAFLHDLTSLFGKEVATWKLVKSYLIKEALPIINFQNKYTSAAADGIYYCGDHLVQASINGAMESGRRTAEEIIRVVG